MLRTGPLGTVARLSIVGDVLPVFSSGMMEPVILLVVMFLSFRMYPPVTRPLFISI